jgi:F-type H+-transporting ATPase subunit delta
MAAVDLRYARALSAVVSEQNLSIGDTQQQLNDFADTLAASAELREVLQNPSIPEPQKLRLLDAIAAKAGMGTTVRNFLALVARHERLHQLEEMIADFATLSDETSHITEAAVISAHPLDAGSRSLLEQQIAKLSGGQQIRATYTEDASLLGGAVVRIGSTVYDGSVRAQLQQLKAKLVAAVA